MVKDVMEFQEEAAHSNSIPDLQEALKVAMTSLGLPYFSYAWSRSSSLDHLEMADDSFFTTVSEEFFATYIKDGLYRNDYSIYACRGTTRIPSLIGRTYHRWKNVPDDELNASELAVEDFAREFFVDGLVGLLENHDGLFFAGASVVGQDMPIREFDHALTNAGTAFQLLRIYHDRFHMLRRGERLIHIRESDLDRFLVAVQGGEIGAISAGIAELFRGGSPASASMSPFEHSSNYTKITLRGRGFDFGTLQARIIGILHAASRTPDPWVPEAELLFSAQSNSQHLRELFKNKDPGFLFERNGIGKIRLKL
ncbi:autoinducer binding domain-containing protein [Magnetospirillum sp. 15-1]|uniref:autoinducer binding domain-containing protein n=1 Tax=Magnetospirillum sp. 15-1 TaxID=1979370 RepID=UPI000BBC1C12|nr:autoinducer binding domain-containing protein [Magnetospirillum sp. 15-1]